MGPAMLQLFGKLYIVFQRIFIALGVGNVAGIADGGLSDLILIEHLFQGHLHARQPV